MDAQEHRQYIGVSNERILDNLKKVVAFGTPVVIRIPIVPGHNGTRENMLATARFIVEELGNRVKQVQLLPFKKLGEEKYAALGMPYPMAQFQAPERSEWEQSIREYAQLLNDFGIPAVAGSGSKIVI
jgi:pyruvate formate lyase activating enzyme